MNRNLFKELNASNQNNKVDLHSDLAQHLSSIRLFTSNWVKLERTLKRHAQELFRCRAYVSNRLKQVEKHSAQCRDAWESTSLEEMIQKRDLILKTRR